MNNLNPQNNSNIFNQNMNNNNYLLQNNNNILNNNINSLTNETIPKEILARRDYVTYAEDTFTINCEKINIIFSSNTGVYTNIAFTKNKSLKELFTYYAKVMGIDENLLGKNIFFFIQCKNFI